jgi:D-3-phosphoglycerate dehydrogenase / 2-oxoglutarate reductase
MRVLLLESLHEDALELLMDAGEISFADLLDAESVAARAQGCVAILTRGMGRIPAQVMQANPQLKCVARCGAGVDNIDVAVASARGLPVVNAPGASTQSVAEHTLMLMLMAARQAARWDRAVKSGQWRAREAARGVELAGKVLGIAGMGRIGCRVAEMGKALGMRVVYWSRGSRDERYDALSFAELLGQSDVLSLHTALTEETRDLLGTDEFAKMRRGAILVNTARGALLDEDALYEALTKGPLGAAGLDVLATEPPPDDHPLLELDNVVFSPHIGGITDVAYRAMCVRTVEQVLRILRGETPDARNVANWRELQAM